MFVALSLPVKLQFYFFFFNIFIDTENATFTNSSGFCSEWEGLTFKTYTLFISIGSVVECTLCALFMELSFLFPIHLIFVCLALSSILLITGSHCGIRSVALPRISGSFL